MAVPPVGSSQAVPPPSPARPPKQKPAGTTQTSATGATSDATSRRTERSTSREAREARREQAVERQQQAAERRPAARSTGTAASASTTPPTSTPATGGTTAQTVPAPSPVEKALAGARATRQRVDSQVAAGRFDQRGQGVAPTSSDDSSRQAVSLGRAERLVSRVSVAQLYGQAGNTGLRGETLGQRVDSAASTAQQELDQILQRARRAQQTP